LGIPMNESYARHVVLTWKSRRGRIRVIKLMSRSARPYRLYGAVHCRSTPGGDWPLTYLRFGTESA
jgi:hypothetical protein